MVHPFGQQILFVFLQDQGRSRLRFCHSSIPLSGSRLQDHRSTTRTEVVWNDLVGRRSNGKWGPPVTFATTSAISRGFSTRRPAPPWVPIECRLMSQTADCSLV